MDFPAKKRGKFVYALVDYFSEENGHRLLYVLSATLVEMAKHKSPREAIYHVLFLDHHSESLKNRILMGIPANSKEVRRVVPDGSVVVNLRRPLLVWDKPPTTFDLERSNVMEEEVYLEASHLCGLELEGSYSYDVEHEIYTYEEYKEIVEMEKTNKMPTVLHVFEDLKIHSFYVESGFDRFISECGAATSILGPLHIPVYYERDLYSSSLYRWAALRWMAKDAVLPEGVVRCETMDHRHAMRVVFVTK